VKYPDLAKNMIWIGPLEAIVGPEFKAGEKITLEVKNFELITLSEVNFVYPCPHERLIAGSS